MKTEIREVEGYLLNEDEREYVFRCPECDREFKAFGVFDNAETDYCPVCDIEIRVVRLINYEGDYIE